MPSKHSPGYLAAYAAATREAARRFREDNPDEWAHILQRQLAVRGGSVPARR